MDHHGAGIDPSLWVAIDGFKGKELKHLQEITVFAIQNWRMNLGFQNLRSVHSLGSVHSLWLLLGIC